MARPLNTYPFRQTSATLSLFPIERIEAVLVANLSLNKNFVPEHEGALGVRFLAKVLNPNAGVHFFFVLGGGPTDTVGVVSPEAVWTAVGANTSPRLDVDISAAFSGRDMEFLKLFAYYVPGGTGGIPILDTQTVILSGDVPPPPAEDKVVLLCDLDAAFEVETTTEALLYEWSVDLSALSSLVVEVALMGIAQVDAGVARIRVRLGGTPGSADGQLVTELVAGNLAWTNEIARGTCINPAAQVLVKVTGLIEGGVLGNLEGATLTIKETV